MRKKCQNWLGVKIFEVRKCEAETRLLSKKEDLFKNADVLIKINPFDNKELKGLKKGQIIIAQLFHKSHPKDMKIISKQGATAFSMDAIPRISRAQDMDVLSSQANLGGYKAVILGANHMEKIFPMMMTAAGTITPAKVLIFGVGVAGLQAIATAKRLGAVVEATDVRPETKEQVESLGGKFIEVKGVEVESEGGYAKEASEDYARRQKEAVDKSLFNHTIISAAIESNRKVKILYQLHQPADHPIGAFHPEGEYLKGLVVYVE